jgi:flagellar hook-associated protein 3 FlgL
MTRVSTTGNYAAVLANLMAAQQRQIDAGAQVSSQKKATDLKGFSNDAEMLTAMRSIQTRLHVYSDQNRLIADKLATQDTGLNQVADAAAGTRQAIADALASGSGDALMLDLQQKMSNAVQGMNTRYGGKYVFAGGQIDTKPVTAVLLADLTAGPPISSFFQNDQFKTDAKIDDSTTVTTGVLAQDIGTNMLTAFKTIQTFNQGPSGPFTGPLTAAQRTFLEGQLATWDTVRGDVTILAARNGMVQKQVDGVKQDLVGRTNSLTAMMGDITDADMALAATQLQQAQMSVQAAAHVFTSLQASSLLNLLR